ncbi:MAG: IPT/TIG domain-containing protein [Pseudomonadota bacterium]
MKSSSKRANRTPVITSVRMAGSQHSSRERKNVAAGDMIEIRGRNFGSDASEVRVFFDETQVKPFSHSISSKRLVVVAPLAQKTTKSVTVEVSGRASKPFPLRVTRPGKSKDAPGASTSSLLSSMDELSGMVSEFAGGLADTDLFDADDSRMLLLAATGLDSYRKVGQQIMEKWMELYPLQKDLELGAMRAIEFYDSVVDSHRLDDLIDGVTDTLFGLASPGERAFIELGLELFGAPFSSSGSGNGGDASISVGDAGFLLHEGVKLVKGMENLFKAIKPSAEVGTPFLGADVEISLGELISAVAELLDIVAQVLQKMSSSAASAEMKATLKRIEQSIERMEEKSDRIETKVESIESRLIETRQHMVDNFEKIWVSFRIMGRVLGETLVGEAWAFSPRQTLTHWKIPDRDVKLELHDIEDKVDRLEEKLDREEDKLDRQEEKLDRQEEKLDRQEEKLDRLEVVFAPEEASLIGQRGGGDNLTALVATVSTAGNVSLRAAIDVTPDDLEDEDKWTDWEAFGSPGSNSALVEVSIQGVYTEESNQTIEAFLSARDGHGNIFHRVFKRKQDSLVIDPAQWGDWQHFLEQPQ